MPDPRATVYSVFLFVTGTIIAGCAPIYMPSTPNTPMLEEQGDARVTLRIGSSGGEFQGAYALSDSYYFFGGLMAGEDDRDDAVSSHRYLEAGGGARWSPVSRFVIEGSGGLGLGSGTGSASRIFTDTRYNVEGGYFKPFLQGNLALQTRVVDAGFVNRLSLIQFDRISQTAGNNPEVISSPSSPVFWEPSVFAHLGWDRIKFTIHMGASGPVIGDPDFDWNAFNISMGASYRFNRR